MPHANIYPFTKKEIACQGYDPFDDMDGIMEPEELIERTNAVHERLKKLMAENEAILTEIECTEIGAKDLKRQVEKGELSAGYNALFGLRSYLKAFAVAKEALENIDDGFDRIFGGDIEYVRAA